MLSSQTFSDHAGDHPDAIDRAQRADFCRRLDQLADLELSCGHHATAERLATLASELRGAQQ